MNETMLTVFYDGSCRLCSSEMNELKALDTSGLMTLVDCSAPSFDDTPWRADGVTREAMLQALHVRDALGEWHRGVDAMAAVYGLLGFRATARAWVHPLLRPLTTRLYRAVVRHRYLLSALQLHRVAPTVLRMAARRAMSRPGCKEGACRTGL